MESPTATVVVHGTCAPGFEPVRRVFEENFRERDEIGAAFAVTRHGEVVADLWAGWADPARTTPWQADTLSNVWSNTKAMTALCAHSLADAGELDIDAPVAKYWPEFAAAGKGEIPVRWLLSHRSGVTGVGLQRPVSVEDLYDWDLMTSLLAAQEPLFEPGAAFGYHALSFGWLVGEVVQRVAGQGIREFFAEQIAKPLGADFVFGLSDDADLARCSSMLDAVLTDEEASSLAVAFANAAPCALAALANPHVAGAHSNVPEWRRAVIPAANGHATALAMATIFGALADGSERILSAGALAKAREGQGSGMDLVGAQQGEWALGLLLSSDTRSYGPNPLAFGHDGYGGSTVGADPEAGISFAYAMNRMGPQMRDDPRKMALIASVYESLPNL
ncbi:MAG TPA: serine hydrolase domain-containing protein [Amycolatopsis sp.]|nr:serine hydrolase domain-containing protein [Amycolatopsis sp.]